MASAVVSASTGPSSLSLRSKQCSQIVDSTGTQENDNPSSPCFHTENKESTNSLTKKDRHEYASENEKAQRMPTAFEIKCKKDKGNSTSSPVKVGRSCSYIQPSDASAKFVTRISLNTDGLPQSPCTYQEKLLKERLNIQGNPDLEQKSLIHPKFLLTSRLSKDSEKGFLSNSPVPASSCNDFSNITLTVPSSESITLQENKDKKEKGNICKTISKYEEAEKKQIKARMKAYAHMKKHILNYEFHEAENKEKDESVMKKHQDKYNAKQMKQKVECPKCQSKSIDGWKHLEQTPGKSFHIQAYKAYKNKNRENCSVDKQEADLSHQKEQTVQQHSINKPGNAPTLSSMHFLKPCEDVIAFYETSRNPKMTSSYPIASQERKMKKKNFLMTETGGLVQKSNATINNNNSQVTVSETPLIREHILSLSSGVFYDGELNKPQNDCLSNGKNAATNDLSQHTNTTTSCNIINVSKPYCFNVQGPITASKTQPMPSNSQNKKLTYNVGPCVNNILQMSKEELFEYERNRLLKDSRGKSNSKKMISKPSCNKESVTGDIRKVTNSGDQVEVIDMRQKPGIANDTKKDEHETEDYFVPKEERDYFDYTYRLCYVDCSKYDGDLSSCANCSVEENSPEKEKETEKNSSSSLVKSPKLVNEKIAVDLNSTPKHQKEDRSSISIDKALQIETKACSELNKWLSNLHNSPSFNRNNGSALSANQPKGKTPTSDQCVPSNKYYNVQNSNSSQSVAVTTPCPASSETELNRLPTVITSSVNDPNKCLLHFPERAQLPVSMNKYNVRNSSTIETFSPSLTQPIFSVLPIEGYHIDKNQFPVKSGSFSCQKLHENPWTNQATHSTKSQGDAVARRALKQKIKSKEASRLSTCSIQSSNEIHILKLHNIGDPQRSGESESQIMQTKESSSSQKSTDPGTLQVRYIPKQFASSQQNKVQTTAHAQIKRDTPCMNGSTVLNTPNYQGVVRYSPSIPQQTVSGDCQVTQSNYNRNSMSTSGVSGPDLLQGSVVQSGASNRCEISDQQQVTSPPQKKQSFFSRFAHSPLSIFYKDAKTNGSK